MQLSISCPTPPPPGGWGNTGDLTNRGVKFPTTGCQIPTMSPPPSRGFDNTSRMAKHAFKLVY